MEKPLTNLCFAVFAGFLAAIAAQSASAQADVSLAAGRRLAATQCGRCHAVDRGDQSPNPRSPPFRTLGSKFPFGGLRQALIDHMIVAHPEMPIMTLTPVEVDDLIAYLKSLQSSARHPRTRQRDA